MQRTSMDAQGLLTYKEGNLEKFDALLDAYNHNNQREPDGTWKLSGLSDAFHSGCRDWVGEENNPVSQLIKLMKPKHPRSKAMALLEAAYWIESAWHVRGHTAASSVSPVGMKLFRENLLRAEAVLLASKEYLSDNPLWYSEYMNVALGLGWKREQFMQLFREAAKRQPYFYPSYFSTITSLSPKWGGNWAAIDEFIQSATKATHAGEGATMYTRMYWELDAWETLGFDVFKDSRLSWPKMKVGFEDILKRHPKDPWTLNNYASFACRAGDKATYLRLRPHLDAGILNNWVNTQAWRPNRSRAICDELFLVKS